ncbi:MAG TPA: SDR family NAD(P)-dependent oxidoreductase [Gemmatimonadaceae bacterium]|nr:SDR family NAD(P)-dependent oxidoreductase [Gemmatimonadaceae bacterium]
MNDFDVAIVGMAGRFPGARNVGEFWRNLAAGVESITQFTDEDILESGVPESHLRNPAYVKASPVLEDPAMFDATFFGYSPVEASAMDPQQRLLLELAYEALEDAGHDPERSAARVGVFTGSALNTYYTVAGLNARITEDYIPTLIGNDKDFLSTRISYKLNLRGPSLAVQTACSTSMVAVHLARQSLLSGETDLAIAGAISVRVPHRAGYICDGGGVVSPDGRVRPFDASANGTVFGSGGGVIVLKRLTDAIADGDTIRAVIKGSAVNNDGSEKAGYTAPSVNSQADAVIEALANANVDAESVSYIEAHGSGTPVGDPIEVAALTKAFRAFTQRSAFCAIGSVKSNVGHLDAAAGMAGIIKTVLALQHKQLPPSLHYTTPNPEIDFANTPFFVSASLRDWAATGPRRAGVMATGMGGTNAHVVLEEAPASSAATETPGPHLLVLSAKTDTALDDATQRLREFVATNAHVGASDIACTLRNGRRAFAQRRFVVCSDRADAVKALDLGAKRPVTGRATDARRSVVLLLPGVSDHYVGMAHELYTRSTVFRAEIDRCAHILQPLLNADIREILYPAGEPWKNRTKGKGIDLRKMLGRSADTPSDAHTAKLNQTQFVQAALFTIEYATTRLWQSLGVLPDAIAGHSMGEYVAACIGGVMSLEDALRLLATRAKLVSALPKGGMLAVTLSEQEVLETLPADLSISLINGPSLCVVAGPPESIAAFEKVLTKRGVICRHVPNTHAFHSRMLAPIADAFEREVRTVTLNAPTIPYISNVTGTWITASEATDPAYWAKHATHTARFSDALRAVWQLDDPLLIEAGPGRTLGVLATQHPDKPHDADATAVASIRHDFDGKSDMEMLYDAIGRVWLTGVSVNWDSLTNAAPTRRVPLPTYPFERRRHWLQPVRNAPVNASASTLQKNANTSEWLYVPSWKRTLARSISLYRAADPVDAARPWLVFADESGFSNALAERIARSGRDVIVVRAGTRFDDTNRGAIRIDPANAEHYTQLVRALQAWQLLPDRVVHAWCADDSAGRDHADAFERAQTAGFFSVLHLARACAALNVRHDMRWFVVSNGAHDVTGTETLHTERATILGPCMVIRQEYPNIRVRSIDVANVTDDAERGTLTDAITGELVSNDPELFVAYRGGQRWVQSYERVRPQAARGIREPFRERGVYLITGGLGTVGAAIATYLAQRYKARIVLVGRAAAPRDPALLVRIAQLGGQALYMSANVSDAHAARRVVDETRRRFGTLHGVIHGAGIVGDGVYREIKDSDAAYCARHFEAKAHGVRALSDALADVRVDFCLLLSSLTSVLGGIGQAAYTSANMYMDVFARHHNRTSRSPWLSVNWDVWRLDTAASSGAGMGATLKDLGMNTAESMSTLEAVLSSAPVGQLVVSTGDLSARIDQWLNLSSLEAPAVAGAAAGALAERPKLQSAYDAPRDDTERRIAEIWQESLGIADIGINDNFAELGGHSLLAVRIVASLRNAFQIDVPVRALFDSPTIASLATAIKDQLIAEIGAMSDEEARRLVSTA